MTDVTRIIGIDPGLRLCGWGVIDVAGTKLTFKAAGTIKPNTKVSLAERLSFLHREILNLMDEFDPVFAAVEETFVNSNPRSALALGQARGVCLMTPATRNVPVAEYPANTIKKTVVGAGHADKTQVQAMIRILLPKSGSQSADAADALAVAVCHAHHMGHTDKIRRSA